ncbi:hypothetical protein [Streptomyces sp. NL15-2K]|nr:MULTISPECIES: hypothetical protein [Actinomycetes]WKX11130.1 hypothetical protein Q4V64_27905 [Kutzneria buriramensis]GCB52079.1 hypothetical protein SNL152K_9435 [Streptomyces sp. NL15-2K]
MTMTDDAKRPRAARASFWRRLTRQAALGAAGAAGSGVVSLLVWWLRGG